MSERASSGPCAKAILAIFGTLFLIALLSVPVTTRSFQLRQDPRSNIVFKTTYPRRTTMFLPRYLSAGARLGEGQGVDLRSEQWLGTMAIVVVLGVFDYLVFCRLLRRPRRRAGEEDSGPPDEGSPQDRGASGLSLFP